MTFTGKILIADDEPHIRKFVTLVLRRLGTPTIVEAKNGAEAVELFEREAPELVLLDVNMPVMDGLQALGRIREKNTDVTVVMLTSLANRSTIDEALQRGADAYLRKDVPPDELTRELRKLLEEEPETPDHA